MGSGPVSAKGRLVAVAPDNPLARRTFSGLSASLFGELQRQGVAVAPIASRDLRWQDALDGAVRWAELLRRPSRKRTRVDPDWYWSRRVNERMTRRFRAALDALGDDGPVLQVGTHVQAAGGGRRAYCITDLTVVQAIGSGAHYQVARASAAVRAEAVAWQQEIFDACEKVFVLSEWTRRSVVEDYEQRADKVITVGAGANVPAVLPPRAPNNQSPAILFVGLDWEQKGGPVLLEAFRRVRAAIPAARLLIVGCNPTSAKGEPGVDVLGRLDRADPDQERQLLEAYAGSTCFCILPDVDAFPNVLLEASAFGLPVVSTDVGSRSEVVKDGVTGRLVEPGDTDALAQCLIEILSEPELAERLGTAAAQQVAERFNWAYVARLIMEHMSLKNGDASR